MKKVLVKGPVLSRSGYGEHARFILRALRANKNNIDIHIENINWGKTGWIYDKDEEREWIDEAILKNTLYTREKGVYDISFQITIPNEWEKIAPVNIGVTAGIETTKVSPQWIIKSQVVDKIVTISEHSKQTYQNTVYTAINDATGEKEENFRCIVPIDVVHYPVRIYEPRSVKLDLETDFNFLVVAQWSPRKNIENTIKWFVEEFIDVEVGLVVKSNVMNNSNIDRTELEKRIKSVLSQYKNRKCKVYMLHGDMSDSEMTYLYNNPKIKSLISLAHGEGFGLPIFEAAYNGLPVLAVDWSGHVDYLYKPTQDKKGKIKKKPHFARVDYDILQVGKESVWDGVIQKDSGWCYAQQGSYKMRLREVYKDHGRFLKQANTLKDWICENFSKEKQYEKLNASVAEFIEDTSEDWLKEMENIITEYE